MSLQDAIRRLDAVCGSAATSGCQTTEEPPRQSYENIGDPEARREFFRRNLRRVLEEGHLGAGKPG